MKKYPSFWLLLALLFQMTGCKDFTDAEIYQRPEHLEGKLFDVLKLEENSDLSTFAACLELSGLSGIMNSPKMMWKC